MNKNTLTPDQEARISNARDQMEYHLREAKRFDNELKELQKDESSSGESLRKAQFIQSRRDQHNIQSHELKKYLNEQSGEGQ